MSAVFLVIFVLAIATFLAAFAYDYTQDWDSRSARKVGVIAWLVILFSFVGAVVTSEDDDKSDDGNKVMIECVVGDDQTLTCEVVE